MGAYKRLDKQDVFITSYPAKKQWKIAGDNYSSSGIQTISITSGSSNYYDSIKHLYFSLFEDGVIPGTGSYENYLQSSFEVSGSRELLDYSCLISIPRCLFGTNIEPGTIVINTTNDEDYVSGSYWSASLVDTSVLTLIGDEDGRLLLSGSSSPYIGTVIYPHGQIIITDETFADIFDIATDTSIEFKSNHPIYTHNYYCRVKAGEFNHTLNKTTLSDSSGSLLGTVTGSNFQPYFTTVGLYNDANELIAVAKTGQPIPKSGDIDMTVVVKIDI